ncbi:hypothetical protein MUK42_01811 [Musa troglodytarum]|uniref:Uncharacterized protein n=1 Tax=Musa troglodytarum TaxID=320322 RepID=A0A9E7LE38_9LILI|nr:hypothetical protein MUK42_01811 [Musa troglodytarum]
MAVPSAAVSVDLRRVTEQQHDKSTSLWTKLCVPNILPPPAHAYSSNLVLAGEVKTQEKASLQDWRHELNVNLNLCLLLCSQIYQIRQDPLLDPSFARSLHVASALVQDFETTVSEAFIRSLTVLLDTMEKSMLNPETSTECPASLASAVLISQTCLAELDPQCTTEVQPSSEASHVLQGDHQNSPVVEAPKVDSGSVSVGSSNTRKVSREDIELVQNLIERCLQLYMNRREYGRNWKKKTRIFRAYYIRLKLKKQIILFNHLLEHQYHLMKYPIQPKVPLAPIQNGIHPVPVSLPMGYPILPQHLMPATGQPHVDPMGCGLSSCHVVNGIPAPGSFHPIRMNSGTNDTTEAAHTAPPAISSMSEMAVSPASAASSNRFPFSSEISGIGLDVMALDATFPPDVANSGLQLGSDGVGSSRDSIRSSGQLWNFSLSDLTADLTNLGDLGVLGDYDGSPFLPSDSDILLDSPEPDDIVEEYFADVAAGSCPHQSDEEKS